MPTVTLQVIRQENNGVVYADPAKPDTTCRFRSTTAQKTLNGVQVQNIREEIIYNDSNPINPASGVNANDAISVRLSISGTVQSKARITNILNSMVAQLPTWVAENVIQGFRPSTAPAITTP